MAFAFSHRNLFLRYTMMRKSRITLSKPKTAASRKETHERVNEHAEKATGSRREIEDRYSTQGEFPSSSCLIRNAGKERARRTRLHVHIHTCDIPYAHVTCLARRRSLTCIHAAIFIVAGCCSKLVLCEVHARVCRS